MLQSVVRCLALKALLTLIHLCVGTLITEWDAGKQICAEFLLSEANWRCLADKLVNIAVHYGFDGWLVNIENALEVWCMFV